MNLKKCMQSLIEKDFYCVVMHLSVDVQHLQVFSSYFMHDGTKKTIKFN